MIQRACEPLLYRDFITFDKMEVEGPTQADGQVLMMAKVPFQGSPTYFSLWHARDTSLRFEVGNGFVFKTYVFDDGFEAKATREVEHLKGLVGETIDMAKAMNNNFAGETKNRLVKITALAADRSSSLRRPKRQEEGWENSLRRRGHRAQHAG